MTDAPKESYTDYASPAPESEQSFGPPWQSVMNRAEPSYGQLSQNNGWTTSNELSLLGNIASKPPWQNQETQKGIGYAISIAQEWAQQLALEATAAPDHPCNYCHQLHWYAGPSATPCTPGTKTPNKNKHRRGHGQKKPRLHLPATRCTFCDDLHWFSGPYATPCGKDTLRNMRRKQPTVTETPEARRDCQRCGRQHALAEACEMSC